MQELGQSAAGGPAEYGRDEYGSEYSQDFEDYEEDGEDENDENNWQDIEDGEMDPQDDGINRIR